MLVGHRVLLALLVAGMSVGCEKQAPSPAPPPPDAPRESPAPKPSKASQAPKPTTPPKTSASAPEASPTPPGMMDPHAATGGAGQPAGPQPTETQLAGLTLQIPEGWTAEVPEANPQMPEMGAKAVFRLAHVEGDSEDVYVRVTHFPGMKVSDEMNLDRWFAAFKQPDGRMTKEVAKVERFEVGAVQVVLADIPGTMTVAGAPKPGTTPMAGAEKADWRMLGAIIKHERGPHFVKVVGPTKSVDHWKASVVAYLKSVKVN